MTEKTVEELEAELAIIKKANVERELAEQKKLLEDAKTLEKEKEETKLRESIREEILSEMGEKSRIQTSTENTANTAVSGVVKSTTLNLAGGEKTDLVMLKKGVQDRRTATEGTQGGALPLDLSKAEAYRAPEDTMDYFSRVRWLKNKGKVAQLKEQAKANRVPGVIGR